MIWSRFKARFLSQTPSGVTCEDQVNRGVAEPIWSGVMHFDPVGRTWGPPEGVMRIRTANAFGWNAAVAAQVQVPTLIVVGRSDSLLTNARLLHADLGTPHKVLLEVGCASHFLHWEIRHRVLHQRSRE